MFSMFSMRGWSRRGGWMRHAMKNSNEFSLYVFLLNLIPQLPTRIKVAGVSESQEETVKGYVYNSQPQ